MVWIFGYGSLIWRPDFRYTERRRSALPDYQRRFYQGSPDHRGTPEAPGRVVTLLPEPGALCWGLSYKVDPTDLERVLLNLDYREKAGYERRRVEVSFQKVDGPVTARRNVILYAATRENPNFLGPASPEEIARQIQRSAGPSGSNREYLLELAGALRRWQICDPHVFDVEAALLAIR